ncbi:choice-of-anchor J domain-containing protein [Flavobacterium noncentrifugens]|uniref:DUF5017 domain-containing protein n=1 Tax=Flavobacterium noncentrifugens TaxID=1128970 RepID=A0A1G8STF8_9FLAO|nr:choice-of-anchor J domain-containing protein [Flavobacterium noncentrifugens]SDJ32471.1 protein of unknown function [Flavobacterium noncentrifugens]
MKTNSVKALFLAVLTAGMLTSCVGDDDTVLPNYKPVIFGEDFELNAVDNTLLALPGWLNYNELGSSRWTSQYYSSNNYAEYSSFNSGDAVNIGWLITPSITLGAHPNEKLLFQSAQSYVTNTANTLEVLISTDFDGTVANVTTAHWTPLSANFPTTTSTYFAFLKSGDVDLSSYSGPVHIAFRVKGSGTNTNLDGSYQIDNLRITY